MFKKLIAVLAMVIVLGGSTMAFAWWDDLQKTQNETLTIGEGVTLEVAAVATAPVGKVLVPAGVVLKANDVTSIVLTYNVKLDLAAVAALNLAVSSSNVQINGSATNAGLVNIVISPATTTVNATNVLITVTITLTAPATVEIYNAIINQPITFTLTFTATQA